MTASALERAIRRGADDAGRRERCDLCACAIPARHRHALDTGPINTGPINTGPINTGPINTGPLDAGPLNTGRAELMCLCRPCALLFERDAASQGHYRLVPERRLALDGLTPAALGIPVGLAYFVQGPDGKVIAHYPSPLGSTTWEVDADAWRAAVAACPPLASLAPDVEALLVNSVRGSAMRWIVPIEDCFRLIALIGREWSGLSGGSRVWPAVEAFFAALREGNHE